MGTIVKKVDLNWLDRTYLWPISKGLFITIKHFIVQIITPTPWRRTVQYPGMKRPVLDGYRGLHELKRWEDGSIKCVACYMCCESCPSRCITIVAEEIGSLASQQGTCEKRPASFQIDLMRCIFCGMCQEACPRDAIWLRKNYELSCHARDDMRLNKYDLMNTYCEEDGKAPISPEPLHDASAASQGN